MALTMKDLWSKNWDVIFVHIWSIVCWQNIPWMYSDAVRLQIKGPSLDEQHHNITKYLQGTVN